MRHARERVHGVVGIPRADVLSHGVVEVEQATLNDHERDDARGEYQEILDGVTGGPYVQDEGVRSPPWMYKKGRSPPWMYKEDRSPLWMLRSVAARREVQNSVAAPVDRTGGKKEKRKSLSCHHNLLRIEQSHVSANAA